MNQVAQLQQCYAASQPYIGGGVKPVLLKLESAFGDLLYRRPPPAARDGLRLLNLGCGNVKYEGWVNADFYNFHDAISKRQAIPDWMLDLTKPIRCSDAYWHGIFCEHTLEHLSYAECVLALSEMHRILRPGAWLRVVVPDLDKYIAFYRGDAPHPHSATSGAGQRLSLT
jgi:hypothetical protein